MLNLFAYTMWYKILSVKFNQVEID